MTDERFTVLEGGASPEERATRLTVGADELAGGRRPSVLRHPRFVLAVASVLMTSGLTIIVLGWYGSSRSTHVEEQVPYLISGGLLGAALAIVGALTLFTHWLTVMVRENRSHEAAQQARHTELVDTIRCLSTNDTGGGTRSPRPPRPLRGAPGGR